MNKEKSLILLVDDDDLVLSTTQMALSDQDYEFITANNGKDALQLTFDKNPSLVITDVTMPIMNGLELCRSIKENYETRLISVIVVTAYDALEDKIEAIKAGADEFISKPYNIIELKVRIKALLRFKKLTDKLEDFSKVISALAKAIDARDPYTRGHSYRVSYISMEIANILSLSDNAVDEIGEAGLLHDIGKIGIEESILNKSSILTPKEIKTMQTHPIIGENILKPLKSTQNFRSIIRSHHEKLNGSGYPDGLKDDQILISVRIISISDIFDAMRSDRPYRKGMSLVKTLSIIEDEVNKNYWDREVFKVMQNISNKENITSLY